MRQILEAAQASRAKYWHCGNYKLSLERPLIMAVLNATPDSFSDGGSYPQIEDACNAALRMLDEGADIIDIGGESTRPGSSAVDPKEEQERVIPIIKAIKQRLPQAIISIDTRNAQTAAQALEAGACIINDVSGFSSPEMQALAAEKDCGLILMHMRGTPQTMQEDVYYDDVVQEVYDYLIRQAKSLEDLGVESTRIMIDPGPGFGKRDLHDAALQSSFERFAASPYPVLEAVSRKRFVSELSGIANPKGRDLCSAVLSLEACYQGANMVRVHSPKSFFQAFCASQLSYTQEKIVYVALGSNLAFNHENYGLLEPQDIVLKAYKNFDELPLTRALELSHLYQSKPAYYEEQGLFVNAVAKLSTALPALVLIEKLLDLEQSFGRQRLIKDGPRSLDLDLIFYAHELHAKPRLILPHPALAERDFVIKPLLDLMPKQELEQRLRDAGMNAVVPEEERYGTAWRI